MNANATDATVRCRGTRPLVESEVRHYGDLGVIILSSVTVGLGSGP